MKKFGRAGLVFGGTQLVVKGASLVLQGNNGCPFQVGGELGELAIADGEPVKLLVNAAELNGEPSQFFSPPGQVIEQLPRACSLFIFVFLKAKELLFVLRFE